jgi:hypothetical protein
VGGHALRSLEIKRNQPLYQPQDVWCYESAEKKCGIFANYCLIPHITIDRF